MKLTPLAATGKGPANRFTGDVYVTPIAAPSAPRTSRPASSTSCRGHAPTGTSTPTARPCYPFAIVVASSDHNGTDWSEPVTDQISCQRANLLRR